MKGWYGESNVIQWEKVKIYVINPKTFPDCTPISSNYLYSIFRDPAPGRVSFLHAIPKSTPIQWYILFHPLPNLCFSWSLLISNAWEHPGTHSCICLGDLAQLDFLLAWKIQRSHKSTDLWESVSVMGTGPSLEEAQSEDMKRSWKSYQGTSLIVGWDTQLTLKFRWWHRPCLSSQEWSWSFFNGSRQPMLPKLMPLDPYWVSSSHLSARPGPALGLHTVPVVATPWGFLWSAWHQPMATLVGERGFRHHHTPAGQLHGELGVWWVQCDKGREGGNLLNEP